MIEVSDLARLKQANENTIVENNVIIENKRAENCELQAENRVFEKLIKLYEPTESVENSEEI